MKALLNTIRVEQSQDGNGAGIYLSTEDGGYREYLAYYTTHAKALAAAMKYQKQHSMIEYMVFDGLLT